MYNCTKLEPQITPRTFPVTFSALVAWPDLENKTCSGTDPPLGSSGPKVHPFRRKSPPGKRWATRTSHLAAARSERTLRTVLGTARERWQRTELELERPRSWIVDRFPQKGTVSNGRVRWGRFTASGLNYWIPSPKSGTDWRDRFVTEFL